MKERFGALATIIFILCGFPIYASGAVLYEQTLEQQSVEIKYTAGTNIYILRQPLLASSTGQLKGVSIPYYSGYDITQGATIFINGTDGLSTSTPFLDVVTGENYFTYNFGAITLDPYYDYTLGVTFSGGAPEASKSFAVKGSTGTTTQGYAQSYCSYWPSTTGDCEPVHTLAFTLYDTDYSVATNTRIVTLSPADGEVVSATSSVDFLFRYYIGADDLGGWLGGYKVQAYLRNIDQNTILAGGLFSPSDIELVDENIDVEGFHTFTYSQALGEGNYKLFASLTRNYFGYSYGEIITQENQFIVGTSTFIGAMRQNLTNELNAILAGTNATSTINASKLCNPISTEFSVTSCLGFLFVPDSRSVRTSIENFYNGVLIRVPIGYLTRFVAILNDDTRVSLPTFTVNIQIAPTATTSLTFDIDDMLAGGASLLDNTRDRTYGLNARDIFEPMIKFVIALLVILYIVTDLTQIDLGGGEVAGEGTRQGGGGHRRYDNRSFRKKTSDKAYLKRELYKMRKK